MFIAPPPYFTRSPVRGDMSHVAPDGAGRGNTELNYKHPAPLGR